MLLSVYESFRVSLLIECLLMLEMYFLKTISSHTFFMDNISYGMLD